MEVIWWFYVGRKLSVVCWPSTMSGCKIGHGLVFYDVPLVVQNSYREEFSLIIVLVQQLLFWELVV